MKFRMLTLQKMPLNGNVLDNGPNKDFLDLTTGFDDISNFTRVVIPSTNHRFAYFCDYIIVSKILGSMFYRK